MRAGAVSAAALAANAPSVPEPVPQHCSEDFYRSFIKTVPVSRVQRNRRLAARRTFVERWPDLGDWFSIPLYERVGRLPLERRGPLTCPVSYEARGYLLFLALRGYIHLDYAWILGVGRLHTERLARQLGINLGIEALTAEAVSLGFDRVSSLASMRWCVGRIALHTGLLDAAEFRADHLEELLEAIRLFGERDDLPSFYRSAERYRASPSKTWITEVHQLQTLLFHRGQMTQEPRKIMPIYAVRPQLPPKMQSIVDRWLAARRLINRPGTLPRLDRALRYFGQWLGTQEPEITSFAQVDREHMLRYLCVLAEDPLPSTGRPMALNTRMGHISALATFFQETAAWNYPDVPGRLLISPGDMPRRPHRVPRFIPQEELNQLMVAIKDLECPYQRAALLVARWSGARKGEIRRLAVDCLDTYPDSTPRLRLPAGKTRRERMVPLHDEAALALHDIIARRAGRGERTFTDELTGAPTRYLFMEHGKLLSDYYLFKTALKKACTQAGLVDARGRALISPHRFRHTVGTQLAERGAKLHTIMQILGHQSVSMALVYAQISDPEVLRDYQAVLGSGAILAGPAAEALRSGTLSASTVKWLNANFFKTELELGHCLRLPAEGPCECDLYLTCAKFVTTSAYAPRLRRRRQIELILATEAETQGWQREVERHQATAKRLEQLLAELGESLEGEMADDVTQGNDLIEGNG